MSEVKTVETEIKIPVIETIVEYSPDFGEIMESILPPDVTLLEADLKRSEEKVEIALKGSAKEYIEAEKVRNNARSALRNATALTVDEATAISLNAHKFLLSLHEIVGDFDVLHGISYGVTKKARKSVGNGEVTKAEFDAIPADKKLEGKMEFANGTIFVTGKKTKAVHSCKTIGTWERHLEN